MEDFILAGGLERAMKRKVEHFIPQYEFVCKKDEVVLDFVARYENLEKDFQYISSIVGGQRLQVINKNNEKNIVLSEASKNKLKQMYDKDFKIFGY